MLKKWWFWFGIILLTVTLLAIIFILNKNNGVGTAGITKEEYDKIKIGETTNFEIGSIIDENDEWNNDETYNKCVEEIEKSKEDKKYTHIYKYYGEKDGYAIITFQADYSNGYYYNNLIVTKKENHNIK